MTQQPAMRKHEEEAALSLEKLKAACRWSRAIQIVLWGLFLIALGLFGFMVWLWWFRDGTTADRNSAIFLAIAGIQLFLSACTASVSLCVLEHKKHEKLETVSSR